jgi:hypothetical protein
LSGCGGAMKWIYLILSHVSRIIMESKCRVLSFSVLTLCHSPSTAITVQRFSISGVIHALLVTQDLRGKNSHADR